MAMSALRFLLYNCHRTHTNVRCTLATDARLNPAACTVTWIVELPALGRQSCAAMQRKRRKKFEIGRGTARRACDSTDYPNHHRTRYGGSALAPRWFRLIATRYGVPPILPGLRRACSAGEEGWWAASSRAAVFLRSGLLRGEAGRGRTGDVMRWLGVPTEANQVRCSSAVGNSHGFV